MINLKIKKYKNTYFYLKQKVVIPNNTINSQERQQNMSICAQGLGQDKNRWGIPQNRHANTQNMYANTIYNTWQNMSKRQQHDMSIIVSRGW